jgi:hypothetical protein
METIVLWTSVIGGAPMALALVWQGVGALVRSAPLPGRERRPLAGGRWRGTHAGSGARA